MIARIGTQLALFAFMVSVLAGLVAGNRPVTVLSRALVAMVVVLLAAQLAAFTSKLVLRDYLRSRKAGIDLSHLAATGDAATARTQEKGLDEALDAAAAGPGAAGNRVH